MIHMAIKTTITIHAFCGISVCFLAYFRALRWHFVGLFCLFRGGGGEVGFSLHLLCLLSYKVSDTRPNKKGGRDVQEGRKEGSPSVHNSVICYILKSLATWIDVNNCGCTCSCTHFNASKILMFSFLFSPRTQFPQVKLHRVKLVNTEKKNYFLLQDFGYP